VVSKIIVGVPAFDEEAAIASVVAKALPHAAEVLVVDDGSTDRTSAEALRAGATVIRHRVNSGKGIAIATLFQYAMEEGADVLVLLDGDGQHDADEIPLVAEPCVEGRADVVVGSRFHPDAASCTPRIRRLGQLAFNGMTALASGVSCSDSQSGFRAFNRRAFCAMRLSEATFSVESEMQFECRTHDLRLTEVPITCSYAMPPKRNVLAHGMIVLSRLTALTIDRRALGRWPESALPPAARAIGGDDRRSEASAFEPVALSTTGD